MMNNKASLFPSILSSSSPVPCSLTFRVLLSRDPPHSLGLPALSNSGLLTSDGNLGGPF